MKRNVFSHRNLVGFIALAIFLAAPLASAGGKLKSKTINLKPCPPGSSGNCAFTFRTRGFVSKPGQKHYYKFFDSKKFLRIDPLSPTATGSIFNGPDGMRAIVYTAKKKGRRNCPKYLRDARRLARGIITQSDSGDPDEAIEKTYIPKGRWIVICYQAKNRQETGDYNVRLDLDKVVP